MSFMCGVAMCVVCMSNINRNDELHHYSSCTYCVSVVVAAVIIVV